MRELHAEGKLNATQAHLLNPTRPQEELYDLDADPYEIRNLAEDPVMHDKLVELRAVLDTWIYESNDQGRFAESEEIPQYWEQKMIEYYDERSGKDASGESGKEGQVVKSWELRKSKVLSYETD